MGASQFLRDFRRDYHLKRSHAHRIAVMERKEKAREYQLKVQLSEIDQDGSYEKTASHLRLMALVAEVGEKGMERLYKKNELQILCSAYGVIHKTKWNKSKLSLKLCQAIPLHKTLTFYQAISD